MTRAAGSRWIRLLVTAAILGYLARRIDVGEAVRAMLAVGRWHVVAVLALVAADRAVMIWRWVILLRATGIAIDRAVATHIFLVSSFVGSFLPAGVGADAARAFALMQERTRGSAAVASVLVDRLLGVVAIVALGSVGLIVWGVAPAGPSRRLVHGAALLLVAGAAASLWIDRAFASLVPARHRDHAVVRPVGRLATALGDYRRQPASLAAVLGLSLLVQVLRVAQAWVLGLGLGLAVPLTYYLVVIPVGLLILLLPVSVSGFGAPQGAIVWLLRPAGVPDALGLALATLIILAGLAGNLPGAWLYLRRRSR